jgi:hypothetical protein
MYLVSQYFVLGTTHVSVYYSFLIIIWSLTVEHRILNRHIRLNLRVAAIFTISLLVIRIMKSNIFNTSFTAQRYLWYFYYVPFLTVPLLSLIAAYSVGKPEDEPLPGRFAVICIITALFIVCVLTNDLHGGVFRFRVENDTLIVSHRLMFFVIIAWMYISYIAVYIMMVRRCRSSFCRKYAYIPVTVSGVGIVLWMIYLICGGSPVVMGLKLYLIQEVYAFIFISLWESCIMIGLVSSNTGYHELFGASHLNAVIKSENGEVCYRSAELEGEEFLTRTGRLRGGAVEWKEDVSAIRAVNAALAKAAERIEEENELLEEENRVTAERVRLETQNNAYDEITAHVERQLREINESLRDNDMPELRAKFCLILGTYIKRMSNLMLISAGSTEISTDELLFSVRESIEYLLLLGIDCFADSGSRMLVRSDCVVLAYDIFESVLEQSMYRIHALAAAVAPSEDVLLRIEVDSTDKIGAERFSGELERLDMALEMKQYDGQNTIVLRRAAL